MCVLDWPDGNCDFVYCCEFVCVATVRDFVLCLRFEGLYVLVAGFFDVLRVTVAGF